MRRLDCCFYYRLYSLLNLGPSHGSPICGSSGVLQGIWVLYRCLGICAWITGPSTHINNATKLFRTWQNEVLFYVLQGKTLILLYWSKVGTRCGNYRLFAFLRGGFLWVTNQNRRNAIIISAYAIAVLVRNESRVMFFICSRLFFQPHSQGQWQYTQKSV